MEAKTLEQLFIADYERLQKENEDLCAKLEDLQRPEIVCDDAPEKHPRAYRIDEPIEVVWLDVVGRYELRRADNPVFDMTAEEIREAVSTREGLESMAATKYEKYGSKVSFADLRRRVYPMRIVALGRAFAVDVNEVAYESEPYMSNTVVKRVTDALADSGIYPAECADALYEKGLEILKERLLAYADEKEAADA